MIYDKNRGGSQDVGLLIVQLHDAAARPRKFCWTDIICYISDRESPHKSQICIF